MSGLIMIQAVWHSDGIPERIFLKSWFKKKSADNNKSINNYPACRYLMLPAAVVADTHMDRLINWPLHVYVFVCPINNLSGINWVEPVLSYDWCVLLKDTTHSDAGEAPTPAFRSRVKHSTTEPLHSNACICNDAIWWNKFIIPFYFLNGFISRWEAQIFQWSWIN